MVKKIWGQIKFRIAKSPTLRARLDCRDRNNACFIVKDAIGQTLGYFYLEDEPSSALGGEAAHVRRGLPHGGELRQAAGAAARALNAPLL